MTVPTCTLRTASGTVNGTAGSDAPRITSAEAAATLSDGTRVRLRITRGWSPRPGTPGPLHVEVRMREDAKPFVHVARGARDFRDAARSAVEAAEAIRRAQRRGPSALDELLDLAPAPSRPPVRLAEIEGEAVGFVG